MQVTVLDRGRDGWSMNLVTITISDQCAVCCGPRGTPVKRAFFEDGESYSVDCWMNPCGHLDSFAAVIEEAWLLLAAPEAERAQP
jgi:hypothetical protein